MREREYSLGLYNNFLPKNMVNPFGWCDDKFLMCLDYKSERIERK